MWIGLDAVYVMQRTECAATCWWRVACGSACAWTDNLRGCRQKGHTERVRFGSHSFPFAAAHGKVIDGVKMRADEVAEFNAKIAEESLARIQPV